MFMSFKPLFVRLATKAERSPKTPPPKEIIQSDLLKLLLKSFSIIRFATLKFLFFSLEDNLNIII